MHYTKAPSAFSSNTNISSFLMLYGARYYYKGRFIHLHLSNNMFYPIIITYSIRIPKHAPSSIERRRGFRCALLLKYAKYFEKLYCVYLIYLDAMGFRYFSLGVYNKVETSISCASHHELNYIRSRFDFTRA